LHEGPSYAVSGSRGNAGVLGCGDVYKNIPKKRNRKY
jgi:hypothetical protein